MVITFFLMFVKLTYCSFSRAKLKKKTSSNYSQILVNYMIANLQLFDYVPTQAEAVYFTHTTLATLAVSHASLSLTAIKSLSL